MASPQSISTTNWYLILHTNTHALREDDNGVKGYLLKKYLRALDNVCVQFAGVTTVVAS